MFSFGEGFEDLEHAREAWELHREQVMAAHIVFHRHGRRPWAYWRFDRGFDPDGATRFVWPDGACSEAETIHAMPETTPAEREAIEVEWLRWARVMIAHDYGNPKADPRGHAAYWYGVPGWFYDDHEAELREAIAAERQAWGREFSGGS